MYSVGRHVLYYTYQAEFAYLHLGQISISGMKDYEVTILGILGEHDNKFPLVFPFLFSKLFQIEFPTHTQRTEFRGVQKCLKN